MKIRLTQDTRVTLPAGAVIDVAPEEARNIIALGRGEAVEEEAKAAPKKRQTKAKAE